MRELTDHEIGAAGLVRTFEAMTLWTGDQKPDDRPKFTTTLVIPSEAVSVLGRAGVKFLDLKWVEERAAYRCRLSVFGVDKYARMCLAALGMSVHLDGTIETKDNILIMDET